MDIRISKESEIPVRRQLAEQIVPSSPRRNSGLAIGALAVAAQYALPNVELLLPKDRPAVPLAFRGADEQVELIRKWRSLPWQRSFRTARDSDGPR